MAEELKNKPNCTNSAYDGMKRGWQVMADTVAGTLHLRECPTKNIYLPPEPAEKPEHYSYRRARAIFFNAVDRTLNGLVGMVFRNDPKLSKDVPEAIQGREAADNQAAVEGQWENIDNAGTHGAVFCKEVFTNAMRDGHAAILVDMAPAVPEGSRLEDERKVVSRPYWVGYCADQIINWRISVSDGQTRLDMIVFKEESYEADGEYGEKKVVRYRVLKPGSWELYREVKNDRTSEMDIVPDPEAPGGKTSLKEIPVAIVYGRKKGILQSQPPLLDLALINVSHYQKYSDFSIYLHIASRPILWFRNRDTNKTVEVIGPYSSIDVTADGQVAFAETTGAALEAASNDIKDLESRMSVLGLSLLVKRTGSQVTATEERGDQIQESSDLETAARSMRDVIELCLKFHAQSLDVLATGVPKATTGGNVELGASLDDLILMPEEMTFWSNAVAAGQYSVETMWDVFEKAGKNPSDFDPKREKQRIDKERKAQADLADLALRKFESGNDNSE